MNMDANSSRFAQVVREVSRFLVCAKKEGVQMLAYLFLHAFCFVLVGSLFVCVGYRTTMLIIVVRNINSNKESCWLDHDHWSLASTVAGKGTT